MFHNMKLDSIILYETSTKWNNSMSRNFFDQPFISKQKSALRRWRKSLDSTTRIR